MKKSISALLVVLFLLGTFYGCAKDEAKKATITTKSNEVSVTEASNDLKENSTSAELYDRKSKPLNLDEINIDYSGVTDFIYSYGGMDFCSKYSNDDGSTGFYAINADEEFLLTDQDVDSKFNIINNKIYYIVNDKAQKYTDKYGDENEWKKCSLWIMDIDGKNKQKIFDSEYETIRIAFADKSNIYFIGCGKLDEYKNQENIESCGNLCKYDITKKITTIIKKNVDVTSGGYCNGKIFFCNYGMNFVDMIIEYYEISTGEITSTGCYSYYEIVDNDTLFIHSENTESYLYSISKKSAKKTEFFSDYSSYIINWGKYMTVDHLESSRLIYYFYDGKTVTEKVPVPDDEELDLKNIISKNELICTKDIVNDNSTKFEFYYIKDQTAHLIKTSEEYIKTEDSWNACLCAVGEFVAVICNADDAYSTVRY